MRVVDRPPPLMISFIQNSVTTSSPSQSDAFKHVHTRFKIAFQDILVEVDQKVFATSRPVSLS